MGICVRDDAGPDVGGGYSVPTLPSCAAGGGSAGLEAVGGASGTHGVACGWLWGQLFPWEGWGGVGAQPLTLRTWPLTLRSFRSLLALSADTMTSTLGSRGQGSLPAGSVTRVES